MLVDATFASDALSGGGRIATFVCDNSTCVNFCSTLARPAAKAKTIVNVENMNQIHMMLLQPTFHENKLYKVS